MTGGGDSTSTGGEDEVCGGDEEETGGGCEVEAVSGGVEGESGEGCTETLVKTNSFARVSQSLTQDDSRLAAWALCFITSDLSLLRCLSTSF